jgi:hypothetical protein
LWQNGWQYALFAGQVFPELASQQAPTMPPPVSSSPPSASAQFAQNPIRFLVRGVEMPEYQRETPVQSTRARNRRILWTLGSVWIGLVLMSGLVGMIRFGLDMAIAGIIGAIMFTVLPIAVGLYFVAATLFEWNVLFASRKGRETVGHPDRY